MAVLLMTTHVIGNGGQITLSGTGYNTYDACPAQNVSNFMPTGATLGNLDAVNNTIWGVGCDQDLRQDFVPVLTKLEFIVWNVMEDNFTGSYICVDSVFHTLLGTGAGGNFANPGNFNFSTLKTQDAQYQVVGGVSSVCPAQTTNVGLLTIERYACLDWRRHRKRPGHRQYRLRGRVDSRLHLLGSARRSPIKNRPLLVPSGGSNLTRRVRAVSVH